MITDTHPEAEAVQIALLRTATAAERWRRVAEMTDLALYHARRAIARAHPECSQRERDLIFVRVHYGTELAEQLRAYLESRP